MNKLLVSFQDFFRKHSEGWQAGFQYKEAGAQLLMQAFLQRILNSGGQLHREYGLGMMRTDLLVIWPGREKTQEVVIELKIRYGALEKTITEGIGHFVKNLFFMDLSRTLPDDTRRLLALHPYAQPRQRRAKSCFAQGRVNGYGSEI